MLLSSCLSLVAVYLVPTHRLTIHHVDAIMTNEILRRAQHQFTEADRIRAIQHVNSSSLVVLDATSKPRAVLPVIAHGNTRLDLLALYSTTSSKERLRAFRMYIEIYCAHLDWETKNCMPLDHLSMWRRAKDPYYVIE